MKHGIVDGNSNECAHTDYGEDDPGSLGVTDVSNVCAGSSGCCETKDAKQKNGQYGFGQEGHVSSFPGERMGAGRSRDIRVRAAVTVKGSFSATGRGLPGRTIRLGLQQAAGRFVRLSG